MGPLCPCPTQKAYEKGTRGISWGPLLTLGPRAVPEGPMSCQSAPGTDTQGDTRRLQCQLEVNVPHLWLLKLQLVSVYK
ncbi:unnamed protein product [Staurois parvus]|uniref:Uncharacterized protein n=1 Tax=Staurois parvus TaxID=386267 RepID=A0ABN9AHK4_9NEOB|nr:unnamed protein product [Staurois parvus]